MDDSPTRGGSGASADLPALPDARAPLDGVLAAAWAWLGRGAALASEDFHWPILASVDSRDAARPSADARVVVLRRVDALARELEVHADARTHKLVQLRAAPRACLVFHDRAREVQVRVWAHASVHERDRIARHAWDALAASSRRAYLAPRTPGEPTPAPDPNLPDTLRDRVPDATEAQPGFARFAAIRLRVHALEWLRLDRAGHHRARFDWPDDAGGVAPRATWLRP